jgi:pimeloyl-ACP methyl ester carboxylesterase
MRRALVVVATLVVVLAGVVAFPGSAAAAPTARTRQVHVHGSSVTVDCAGTGSPTVVLFAGFGDSHTIWDGIQRRLARHTRVCSYDRLGEGTSSAPRSTQTLGSNARLLHRVLAKLHIRGPLVLVGHSIGGDIATKYARSYPRSVSGLVTLDATPPGYLPFVLRLIPDGAQGIAAALRQEAVSIVSGDNQERLRVPHSAWARPRSLGHLPLAVVEHGQDIFAVAGSYGPPLQQHWADGQLALAKMSRRSAVIIATRSGHYIYQDQPRLTLDVINAVVAES